MAKATSFMDNVVKGVKDIGNVLHSNDAINKIGKNMGGGFEVGARMMGKAGYNKAGSVGEALTKTFATNGDDLYKNGKRIADAKANWNYGKIAGSYIGVSAAARVASGGGLYKDKNGNTNIAGVPFI